MYLKRDCVDQRTGGIFYCPQCESEQALKKVFNKQYITFLNFPIFVIQQTQTGVECAECRVKFSFRDLQEQEAIKKGRGLQPMIFAGSAVRCVLRLLGAQHELNDDVVVLLREGFRIHSEGDDIAAEDIFIMRETIAVGESVVANVCELNQILNVEQRHALATHLESAAECYGDKSVTVIATELREILESGK
jgi:hypothetical protein